MSSPALSQLLLSIRETRDFKALVRAIPYTSILDLSIEAQDEGLLVTMAAHQRLIGNPALPALHGGTVGALMESAAVFQLLWEVEILDVPKTIDISFDYLRSGRLEDTHARATITKHGRRVANVQVLAWQSDPQKPIATAHGHFLVKTPDRTR